MLPSWRTLDLPPGSVLRARHLDHFEAVVTRLRGGLRPATPRPITVHASVIGTGVTLAADSATFTDPAAELHLGLPAYVGDRLLDWSLALLRATTAGLTVQLRRFAMQAPTYEVLHTQVSLPGRVSLRAAMPAAGLAPVTIEAGWVYRLVVVGGGAGDKCFGGAVTLDHPQVG